jgi:hypothetical protein
VTHITASVSYYADNLLVITVAEVGRAAMFEIKTLINGSNEIIIIEEIQQ